MYKVQRNSLGPHSRKSQKSEEKTTCKKALPVKKRISSAKTLISENSAIIALPGKKVKKQVKSVTDKINYPKIAKYVTHENSFKSILFSTGIM